MWEYGTWVEGKLDEVKPGKTDRQTSARRQAALTAILTGNEAKRYADPASKIGKKRGESS